MMLQPPPWCTFCSDDAPLTEVATVAIDDAKHAAPHSSRHPFVLPRWEDDEASGYDRGAAYVYRQKWIPVLIPTNARWLPAVSERVCQLCELSEKDATEYRAAFHQVTQLDGAVVNLCDACAWTHLPHGSFARIELLSQFDTRGFELPFRED